MKTRQLILIFTLTLAGFGIASADNFSNNFATVDQASLDALAKDLGGAIGGGSFHTGKALGFPLGFDVGAHAVWAGVKNADHILRDDGSDVMSKWVQAEVGLPARINVIGRFGKIEDANLWGGGLRFGILKSNVPAMPSLSVAGIYTHADHDFFTGQTFSANATLSFDVPFIHPYIGAGWDRTKLDVKSNSALSAAQSNLTSTEDGYRVEAGLNLSLIPFTYITLGGGLANGEKLYHAGLGVNF